MMTTRFAFLTVLIVAALAPSAQARKWMDSTGNYSVEAELVDFTDGVVRLKTDDGRMISLPLARLSAADQEYLQQFQIDQPVAEQPAEAQTAESASAESSGNEPAGAESTTDEPENRPSSNDTRSIPDTGGGLSGLIAHGLWRVYQFFPFEGTWDWLLLIVALAVAVRVLGLPIIGRAAWHYSRSRRRGSEPDLLAGLGLFLSCLTDLAWPWLLVLFFSTDAGQTFGKERALFGDIPGDALWWLVGSYLVVALLGATGFYAASCLKAQSEYPFAVLGLVLFHALAAPAIHLSLGQWTIASFSVVFVFLLSSPAWAAVMVFIGTYYQLN